MCLCLCVRFASNSVSMFYLLKRLQGITKQLYEHSLRSCAGELEDRIMFFFLRSIWLFVVVFLVCL